MESRSLSLFTSRYLYFLLFTSLDPFLSEVRRRLVEVRRVLLLNFLQFVNPIHFFSNTSSTFVTMKKFSAIEHSRTSSGLSANSRTISSTSIAPNPFATPAETPAETPDGSVFQGRASGIQNSSAAGGQNYFRSRRIKKDENHVPPVFKKDPKEKFLWIIPLGGLLLGLVITGIMIYLSVGLKATYNYCSVLSDDFSSGVLNPSIWTKEVQVGGFG